MKAYHHISFELADTPRTAIVTLPDLFEYLCMPFQLWNTVQTFQRFMDQVIHNLLFCFVYIDGILVLSKSIEEHVEHLRQLFT